MPLCVKPPAPLITPLTVKVSAPLLMLKVRVADMETARLIVLAPEVLVSLKFPEASAIELPASVYPLPEMVIELKLVPAAMSFEVERFEAPLGKIRSSPATGGLPPLPDQLPPFDQRLFTAPVHVVVVPASPTWKSPNAVTPVACVLVAVCAPTVG